MVTVQSTLGHAHIVDQIIQYLTIMLLDNASLGADSPVVSRFTHVRPQWKVSHHVVCRIVRSLWNLTATSAALLPMCLFIYIHTHTYIYIYIYTYTYKQIKLSVVNQWPSLLGDQERTVFTFFRKSPSWNSPLPIVSRTRRYAITNRLQPLAPLEIHGDVQYDATSCWSSRRARVDLRIIIALLFK